MYIPLATIDVWRIEGNLEAPSFFKALPLIGCKSDICVVGAYSPANEILQWLSQNSIIIPVEGRPFHDSFDLNRDMYPLGRAYAFTLGDSEIAQLAKFASIERGGNDRNLFFEHVLLYRPSKPILPLLDFHDAFSGGSLHLSGHYPEQMATSFAMEVRAKAQLVRNPENADTEK